MKNILLIAGVFGIISVGKAQVNEDPTLVRDGIPTTNPAYQTQQNSTTQNNVEYQRSTVPAPLENTTDSQLLKEQQDAIPYNNTTPENYSVQTDTSSYYRRNAHGDMINTEQAQDSRGHEISTGLDNKLDNNTIDNSPINNNRIDNNTVNQNTLDN